MNIGNFIIVSRHTGAVEWLRQRGIVGEVVAHVTAEQVRGRIVVGNLPLHLAAEALEVMIIDLRELSPDQRGKDLTPAEMDAAGAKLTSYVVAQKTRVVWPCFTCGCVERPQMIERELEGFMCECGECLDSTECYPTEEDALAAWNRMQSRAMHEMM